MVSQVQNIFEDFFDAKGLHACNLSLLLGKDRFSYTITDTQNRVAALRAYCLEPDADLAVALDEVLREEAILYSDFRSVRVGYLHPHQATVPTALFDEERLEDYLGLLVELPEGSYCRYSSLPDLDLKLVFYLPGDLESVLNRRFKTWDLRHVNEGLWQASKQISSEEPPLFANVHERYLSLWCFEPSGRLRYANAFRFENSEGFLYAVLLVKQQLNLREYALHIGGDLRDDSEIYRLLEQYQAPLRFFSRPDALQFGEQVAALAPQSYWDLWALAQLG